MNEEQWRDDKERAFAIAFRGYDRKEVDSFLHKVAIDLRRLLDASVAAAGLQKPYLQMGKEIADLLEHAKRKAIETKTQAEDEAETIVREAHAAARDVADDAERLKRRAEKEAAALLQEARREADKLRREAGEVRSIADAESRVTLRDARKAAKQIRDQARKRADELQAAADFDAGRLREAEERLRRLRGVEMKLHQRISALQQKLDVAAIGSSPLGASHEAVAPKNRARAALPEGHRPDGRPEQDVTGLEPRSEEGTPGN